MGVLLDSLSHKRLESHRCEELIEALVRTELQWDQLLSQLQNGDPLWVVRELNLRGLFFSCFLSVLLLLFLTILHRHLLELCHLLLRLLLRR